MFEHIQGWNTQFLFRGSSFSVREIFENESVRFWKWVREILIASQLNYICACMSLWNEYFIQSKIFDVYFWRSSSWIRFKTSFLPDFVSANSCPFPIQTFRIGTGLNMERDGPLSDTRKRARTISSAMVELSLVLNNLYVEFARSHPVWPFLAIAALPTSRNITIWIFSSSEGTWFRRKVYWCRIWSFFLAVAISWESFASSYTIRMHCSNSSTTFSSRRSS